jgi:hypothetical protein
MEMAERTHSRGHGCRKGGGENLSRGPKKPTCVKPTYTHPWTLQLENSASFVGNGSHKGPPLTAQTAPP